MIIDPPTLKLVPGAPALVSVVVAGALGVNDSVVASFAFVSGLATAKICTTWLLVPCTLYCAETGAPEQVRPPEPQVTTPAWVIETVSPPAATVPSVIVPKSRLRVAVSRSGRTILARAVAGVLAPTGAATAGVAISAVAATDAARHVVRRSFVIEISPLVPNQKYRGWWTGGPLTRDYFINPTRLRLASRAWLPKRKGFTPKRRIFRDIRR